MSEKSAFIKNFLTNNFVGYFNWKNVVCSETRDGRPDPLQLTFFAGLEQTSKGLIEYIWPTEFDQLVFVIRV